MKTIVGANCIEIDDDKYYGNGLIKDIIIDKSVKKIGLRAFMKCRND